MMSINEKLNKKEDIKQRTQIETINFRANLAAERRAFLVNVCCATRSQVHHHSDAYRCRETTAPDNPTPTKKIQFRISRKAIPEPQLDFILRRRKREIISIYVSRIISFFSPLPSPIAAGSFTCRRRNAKQKEKENRKKSSTGDAIFV